MNQGLQDWLLGDGPDPGPEIRRALAEATPSPDLVSRTLAAVEAERDTVIELPTAKWGRGARWGTGLALAAGLCLAILGVPTDERDPTEGMTAKGMDVLSPVVSMQMAVAVDGEIMRVRTDTAYKAGDQLFFHYQVSTAGWLALFHQTGDTVQHLATIPIEAGSFDFMEAGQALSWHIDQGDSRSVFSLVTSTETLEAQVLLEASSAGTVCEAARRLGFGCDSQAIEVQQ